MTIMTMLWVLQGLKMTKNVHYIHISHKIGSKHKRHSCSNHITLKSLSNLIETFV